MNVDWSFADVHFPRAREGAFETGEGDRAGPCIAGLRPALEGLQIGMALLLLSPATAVRLG
jgi:hypothetical protein